MLNPRRAWLIYLLLFGLAVPWYWQFIPGSSSTLIMGMPLWVIAAIVGSAAISAFTAALLSRAWPDEEATRGKEADR